MDKSLIQLQAVLDEARSAANINRSINRMQKRLDKLKVQAEPDPKALLRLKTQMEKATSQKITIPGMDINTVQAVRDTRQTARQMGRALSQGIGDEMDGMLGKTGNSMGGLARLGAFLKDQMSQAAQGFKQWLSAGSAVKLVISQLQKMPGEVYEIDAAMANLYRVTDETDKRYRQFLSSVSDSAHGLGRSIPSLIDQTAAWAGSGHPLDEAEHLAKISSIYAEVVGVDDGTAVSDLATAMKAFNIEASDSITIVDRLSRLGNSHGASAAALGEGLSRSASAMAAAGTDMDRTLAILAGGTEITRDAPGFGSFLKIAGMRIRGMKDSLEQLGEEVDETAGSIGRVQAQVLDRTGGRVDILDNAGDLRDYYDIMEDISEIYGELSGMDRAGLSKILFGRQWGSQGEALIQAFQSGQVRKALEAALDAGGSAMQEQERRMESLDAKTQQFGAAFQSLSSTVLDSGLLKWFVDFGTGAVRALDTVVDGLGSLGTIGLGAGLLTGLKNVGNPKMYGFSSIQEYTDSMLVLLDTVV